MDSDTVHRRRILACIAREERKRDIKPPRDRPAAFRRPRARIRWDRPLPWERSDGDSVRHR